MNNATEQITPDHMLPEGEEGLIEAGGRLEIEANAQEFLPAVIGFDGEEIINTDEREPNSDELEEAARFKNQLAA